MVQGSMKINSGAKNKKLNSEQYLKNKLAKEAKTKKGNPSKHGRDRIGTREDFAEEKLLSKAIDKANEAKCAAKFYTERGLAYHSQGHDREGQGPQ